MNTDKETREDPEQGLVDLLGPQHHSAPDTNITCGVDDQGRRARRQESGARVRKSQEIKSGKLPGGGGVHL